MAEPVLPASARVVVVGGGVIGCSVAYHLAHLGWNDVVLIESDRLTAGTTWHAAGLMVTFGSSSATSTEMRLYTRDLYARLEGETGLATGFMPVGFIELAADRDRLEEYRRVAAFNRYCGVDVHELSAREVAEMFPLARVDDVLAGFYVPGDGRVNPVDVTMSLARGARARGVRVVEGVAVTDVTVRAGAVTGVRTTHGEVAAEYVVNCAGMWAGRLAARAGVAVPLQAAEHYYLITEPIAGVSRELPVIEDPSRYGYYREETGGLMVGLFEPEGAPWKVDGVPDDFSFGEIEPDWDRMAPHVDRALSRVPVAQGAGIRKFFCGPESFTPDLAPVVGEAPELHNYFVAAGLNSVGILTGGGIGRVVAEWIVQGHPDVDVTGIDICRLHPYQTNPEYRRERTAESLGLVYRCHYPTRTALTARGAKRSPLHHLVASQGACFRDVSGWESAAWYAPAGHEPDPGSPSWGRPGWFEHWAAEHRAAREEVVVFDMSFMAKFAVEGSDAGRLLDRLSTAAVDGGSGRISYTQWLNDSGTIEADLTVTKLDDGRFWVVASDTAHRHVAWWMDRNTPPGAHVHRFDATSGWALLSVQGPRSRELIQSVTSSDLSDEAFPYRDAREVDIAFARVLCVRITYVGELGYELYIPAEQAVNVYERLSAAGRDFGLRHAGLAALSSLRLEKGYRDYGHDIDNTDSLDEAGLGFTADLDKTGGFIGRDALLARRAAGRSHRRLVQVLLGDPEPLAFHGEVVYRDGSPAGYLRSASYGFTLGAAVGLAMIEADRPVDRTYLTEAGWEVDVAGRRYPATVSLAPLYDPAALRIRA